jgi:transcriptional regulator with PAS, ATPase and Fis domain
MAIDVQFLQTFANLAAIAINNAKLYEATKDEARYWKDEASARHGFENLVTVSGKIETICRQARSVARSTASVLVTGESGTGKELFARAIHYHSPRRENRFMPINCSALPEHILESELFGVKKGAYTGAVADTKGLFEEANGGTIFLDEIADMQPSLQSKLLRVLQEGEIRRVGDTHYRFSDVRIVSATNKDIREAIQAGRFREDLYYRLCGIELHIPPLRERKEDIPSLVLHFVRLYCQENQLALKTISPEAFGSLQEYSFPGNVRELQNIVRRGVLLSQQSAVITSFDLPQEPSHADPDGFSESTRQHILKVLEKVGWNQTKAAQILGLNRTTLQAKMKKLEIERR